MRRAVQLNVQSHHTFSKSRIGKQIDCTRHAYFQITLVHRTKLAQFDRIFKYVNA